MPRIDHRVTIADILSYEQQMLVAMLTNEINVVREAVGLPLRDAQYMRQEARAWIRAHPRNEAR